MSGAIDLPTFTALQEAAGEEFVAGLVDTFLEEAPAMMKSLDDALARRDAEVFRRAAHSLKSNSYTFGALELGARAKDLELGGFEAAKELGALREEYGRAAAALRELRDA